MQNDSKNNLRTDGLGIAVYAAEKWNKQYVYKTVICYTNPPIAFVVVGTECII